MIKGIFMSENEYQIALENVRADERRKFAEWIHQYLGNSNNVLYTYRESPVGFTLVNTKSVDEILAEYEKENEQC